jgi:hypothetical protein
MKHVKVLGTGCRNCAITAKAIAQAASEAGVAPHPCGAFVR